MSRPEVRNLDLNLLVTLDAILRERSVTRAAAHLGVTQPAVSRGLARLRRHFHDELLVRHGNKYSLTPLAEQLSIQGAATLLDVQRLFSASSEFRPGSDEREFTIMVSDYAAMVLGDHLANILEVQAPGARLRMSEISAHAVSHVMETLRNVDGIVMPHGFLVDVPAVDLFHDSWVLIAAEDHPDLNDSPTLDDIAQLPWVVGYHGRVAFTPPVQQLRMLGIEPNIQVVTESFLALPFLVSGTRRVALIQRKLAHRLAPAARVKMLPCPWEVVPLAEAFWWHPIYRADPAHIWLRSMIAEAGRAAAAELDL